LLQELGIHQSIKSFNLYPNRYIDRTRYYKINELQNNVTESTLVKSISKLSEFAKGRKRLVATFVDDTGQMELVVSGTKWIRESLKRK
jgi:ATP-dependent DNA helicase RecG